VSRSGRPVHGVVIGAVVGGVFAGFGVHEALQWRDLSAHGVAGQAAVVDVRVVHGGREVTVELRPPAPPARARLLNWHGAQHVGDVLPVRYAADHPGTVAKAGTSALNIEFGGIVLAAVAGVTILVSSGRQVFRRGPDQPAAGRSGPG
jgi:hypothetical protein